MVIIKMTIIMIMMMMVMMVIMMIGDFSGYNSVNVTVFV